MRTFRLTLSFMTAAAVLVGSAVGVAGQDAPGPEAAALVSGAFIPPDDPVFNCASAPVPDATQDAGVYRERRWVCGGRVELGDPRLSGELTMVMSADRYIPGLGPDDADPYALFDPRDFADILWGTATVENEAGAWTGRHVGTTDITSGLAGITYYELAGSGAYDGLSAVLFESEGANGNSLKGVIFPGALTDDR